MSDTVISVENISKIYRLGEVGTGSLAHDVNRWWHRLRGKDDPYLKVGQVNDRTQVAKATNSKKKNAEDWVYALKDISFEVKRGEVLGIIGQNGAGKSTLLKILSRVTTQTTGHIRLKGRVASLLEVGTGFHSELTGRENLYLNGAILGMRKREIIRKFDEIVDFSGCERYIDTPVKRYSSGMYVRLAFAVAAFLEPEILIVDEVLAVGDASFQRKCLGKMKSVAESGDRTVLFVSHNMSAVKSLCTTAIYLDNGQLTGSGAPGPLVDQYLQNKTTNQNSVEWPNESTAPGNESVRLHRVSAKPPTGFEIPNIDSGVDIEILFTHFLNGANLDVTLYIISNSGDVVFETGILVSCENDSVPGKYLVTAPLPSHLLNCGKYHINLVFGQDQRHVLLKHDAVVGFELENTNTGRGRNMHPTPGVIRPMIHWRIKRKS
ncbi:MAG: ATP-binding cassette domain-containing protein [Verrucomicrobia bacterium]|nr:ATP-binding cassette domain-containing protein [Verrucomicrobiota bacterium]